MDVDFAGFIGGGHQDKLGAQGGYCRMESNHYRPTNGAWLLYNYGNSHTRTCLMAVPSRASVRFEARLDYGTNPIMAERGLHGDMLQLVFEKNGREQRFTLDTRVSLHNSARFGFSH